MGNGVIVGAIVAVNAGGSTVKSPTGEFLPSNWGPTPANVNALGSVVADALARAR
jgi:hypothetical protein